MGGVMYNFRVYFTFFLALFRYYYIITQTPDLYGCKNIIKTANKKEIFKKPHAHILCHNVCRGGECWCLGVVAFHRYTEFTKRIQWDWNIITKARK